MKFVLAARVCEQFIALMDRARSPLNGRYFVHLFSFRLNLNFGKATGATPDGRLAGEPLAYSLSACPRLRLAQRDPEKYGNIAVRVAGYSHLFKLIDKPMQEHIIARTKHSR